MLECLPILWGLYGSCIACLRPGGRVRPHLALQRLLPRWIYDLTFAFTMVHVYLVQEDGDGVGENFADKIQGSIVIGCACMFIVDRAYWAWFTWSKSYVQSSLPKVPFSSRTKIPFKTHKLEGWLVWNVENMTFAPGHCFFRKASIVSCFHNAVFAFTRYIITGTWNAQCINLTYKWVWTITTENMAK
jgi:hypothetical protein